MNLKFLKLIQIHTNMSLQFLPKELEDIVKDYKEQLELKEFNLEDLKYVFENLESDLEFDSFEKRITLKDFKEEKSKYEYLKKTFEEDEIYFRDINKIVMTKTHIIADYIYHVKHYNDDFYDFNYESEEEKRKILQNPHLYYPFLNEDKPIEVLPKKNNTFSVKNIQTLLKKVRSSKIDEWYELYSKIKKTYIKDKVLYIVFEFDFGS